VVVSDIFVRGYGAVSPAGWGAAALCAALDRNEPLSIKELAQPQWNHALRVRAVPTPSAKHSVLSHARLRRTSPIAHYAVAAALEAFGQNAKSHTTGHRLGIIYCAMTGCVKYSQRFYDEALKDPSTASPLIFPETVFNAPASHLSALLGTTAINYTLVGDPGTFLQGLALAADWLLSDRVDGCLVIGAEELDWLVAEAFCLFDRRATVSEGAGALYLTREPIADRIVRLNLITTPEVFSHRESRRRAALHVRQAINGYVSNALLCDSRQGLPRLDAEEEAAWGDWKGSRVSPKIICGEAFMAAAAWQCVAAVNAIEQGSCPSSVVSVVGTNEQAIAAEFVNGTTRQQRR